MAYSWFRTDRDRIGSIVNTNGEPLYLDEYKSLLREIIERNDVPTLNCYIQQLPKSVLRHDGIIEYDLFWVAASYSSTDALRVLFDSKENILTLHTCIRVGY